MGQKLTQGLVGWEFSKVDEEEEVEVLSKRFDFPSPLKALILLASFVRWTDDLE